MATKNDEKKKKAGKGSKASVARAAKSGRRGGRRGKPASDVKAGPGGRKTKSSTRRNAVTKSRVAKRVVGGGGRGGGR